MGNTTHSLERFLRRRYAVLVVMNLLLSAVVIYLASLDVLESITLLLVTIAPVIYLCWQTYRETNDVLERVGLQLDALGNEEFNAWHLARFEQGRVNALKGDVTRLTQKMLHARDAYAQQESVLLSVIEQLSVPVVIFDAHARVYSANRGFAALVAAPHEMLPGRYAAEFGLEQHQGAWQFSADQPLGKAYRVYENHVFRGNRKLDIVMCFSVERTLRDNEKQVWQRLLRVLNHEIRNSLTPISSIAQSLQHMPALAENHQKSMNLLQVIEQRASHLLNFVEAYSAFNRVQAPDIKALSPDVLAENLSALYPDIEVNKRTTDIMYADVGQLQQALINLIKNAIEASAQASDVSVVIEICDLDHVIKVLDRGEGIQNPDNLFVPFYSTKAEGNGIGLVLSRELVRQQGGELTLQTRRDGRGAEAIIILPQGHPNQHY